MGTNKYEPLIMTPIGRCQYVYLDKPDTKPIVIDGVTKPADNKYKLHVLFKKETMNIQALEDAVTTAAKNKWGADCDMKKIKFPFIDGDEKIDKKGKPWEGFPGHWAIKADSKKPQPIVGKDGKTILEPTAIYPGCYVKVKVSPAAMLSFGNRTVRFYLYGVQFAKDGERFTTGTQDGEGLKANFEPITDEQTVDF